MICSDFRPKTFREVSGQKLPKSILKAISLNPKTSPRVLILDGEYGTGKTSCARIFAKALNCKYKTKDGDACGICDDCKQDISKSMFYTEYDSAVIGNITDIKELKETFYFNESVGYKVIVLDEAHLITPQAQSTLLKLFEDNPSGIFFVLCTTNSSKILNTIKSIALTLKFDLLSEDDIKKNLKSVAESLQIDINDDIINLITKRSKGHLRNAHMLLEQYKMLTNIEFLELFINCEDLYKKFLLATACKRKDIANVIINKLARCNLSDLKSEYEKLVLDIIRCMFGVVVSEDKDMNNIISSFKHSRNKFIDILNDYRNYNMFNSDTRFISLMWLLYEKITSMK